MAELPDPTATLSDNDRAIYDRVAAVRSHAEGRAALGAVYVSMFNNPSVAAAVGALGQQLRFHGVLPDEVRELVIMRFAARQGLGYEWSHHQRPAALAGIEQSVIDELTAGRIPPSLPDASQAVLGAVDAVVAKESIATDVQRRIIDAHGAAGIVELVALCGLYALVGYMVTAFDIPLEAGLPPAPFGA